MYSVAAHTGKEYSETAPASPARFRHEVSDLPESIRFLVILACIGGAVYGAMWALSSYPPEQSEIVKELPSEKFRQ